MILTLMAIACTLMLAAGQVLWKLGLGCMGGFMTTERGFWDSALALLASPWILAGVAVYGLATLLWFYVLSRLPLSLAYPLMSTSYVVAVLAGGLLFHEVIPPARWAGLALVVVGVVVIARA